jgi:murein DD-endopeptidase MepM/ murein hydrolase activator NlpD
MYRGSSGFGMVQFISYTVKAGDTLSAIADQFNTDVATIAGQNMIADPNKISVGQQLDIPVEDTAFNTYYAKIATSPAEFTAQQIATAGQPAIPVGAPIDFFRSIIFLGILAYVGYRYVR